MSKFHLCELGMAALFHDIGKTEVPRRILEKQEELDPEEQRIMEAHPLYGVKKVMELKGLDTMTARIVTGVFEHHMMADYSGYPRIPYRRLSLFGRIIGIADSYDALTSSRVVGRTPFPPEKALRFMLTRSGKEYDLPLLKLFINCVGLYGMGTLLLLESGEVAVVVGNNQDPAQWDNPLVKVIADAGGAEVPPASVGAAEILAPRKVTGSVDPSLFGVDVSRYLD